MGGEELKWHQLAHHQLMSQQGPHFSPHSKAKANYKSTNLRKIGYISDVAIVSVHSEKNRLKKMIMIIISMKKSQESMVFGGRQKLTSATKLRPEKRWVDFKFDPLYR